MTAALPEPATLTDMHDRKCAADARIAEAARRHRERRAVAARRPEPETPASEPEPASPFAAQVAADPNARAILDHARHARIRREIIANVAAQHGLTSSDIIGASRVHAIVSARHAAIAAVASAYPHLSLPALGRAFGSRDHTTILHALRKIHGADYRHESTAYPPASPIVLAPPSEALPPGDLICRAQSARALASQRRGPDPRDDLPARGPPRLSARPCRRSGPCTCRRSEPDEKACRSRLRAGALA